MSKLHELTAPQIDQIFLQWSAQYPGKLDPKDVNGAASLIGNYIIQRNLDVSVETFNAAANDLRYALCWAIEPPFKKTPVEPAPMTPSEKLRKAIHDPELMKARREKQLHEDLKNQRENRGPSREEIAAAEKAKQDAIDAATKTEYFAELEAEIKRQIAGYVSYRGNRIDHLRTEEGRKKLAILEMRKGNVRDAEGTLWLVLRGVKELGDKDSTNRR
jgi:hypothetical protein